LKILFITNGFPPTRWAGTETYTAAIASELRRRGHEIQVLCCGDWHDGAKHWNGYIDDVYNGIPVRRINLNWQKPPNPQKYLYDNPVVARFLDDYFKEINPDLVHVTSGETLSASVLVAVKKNRIPLVLSITDFWFLCPRINLLRSDGENCNGNTTPWDCLECTARGSKAYRWSQQVLPERGAEILLTELSKIPLVTRQRGFRGMIGDMADRKRFMRYAFSLPDARLVASSFVRDVHIQNGFDDPIRLHPYGHDLSWLKNYQGKEDSGFTNIGFIGQITHSKGVHLLLEAAHRFSDPSHQVKFLIYGNLYKHPEYARRLENLADGLETVMFCGTYPRESSAEVYSKIDVLVVPSLWYDFPLIIYEAFATKTPVIATNLGGMAEAVSHEVNGLVFERGNVEDLVHQIRRVVSEPGLIKKLKSGIPRVKTVAEDVDEIEEIYLELLEP
jgi:glycosyltransferase involved in cell wall biosynthesis